MSNPRPKKRTYSKEYYDPRVDQYGISAGYQSNTSTKSNRNSDEGR